MGSNYVRFNTGAVKPIECFKTGWDLIKERYWLFLGITFVGSLLGGIAPLKILFGPMMCGIFMNMLRTYRGGNPSFATLFKGFDHFKESLIATLILLVSATLIMAPFMILMTIIAVSLLATYTGHYGAHTANPVPVLFLILSLMTVVIIALSQLIRMFFIFSYQLIVDRGMTGVDAAKSSVKAAWGNLGGMLGLILLNILLIVAGFTCCYVGVIFVMPISMAAFTAAYLQVFGNDAEALAEPGPSGDNTVSGL